MTHIFAVKFEIIVLIGLIVFFALLTMLLIWMAVDKEYILLMSGPVATLIGALVMKFQGGRDPARRSDTSIDTELTRTVVEKTVSVNEGEKE